ncbi:TonB-dependent receptor [Sphingomonas oligophenolica]|uniref:TonB-dependent receptor n=1 Tax=Sphingomonas oligophenolica TaxID=301154 RepID=A0A502CGN5_9SPHN|nr:TonB-dependent receptor [Sphingomonas oligophenolica]TPG11963.1 TonB-dependent receptor [Sphingomonas oligophenolica]
MRNNLFLGVAAVALIVPAAVSAQETTSQIRGSVSNGGAPVAGADVAVLDVNSGTRSSATTGADGSFSFNGLRPGGPYTVTVTSADGNQTVTDIYTVVQQVYSLPIELSDTAAAGSAAGTGTGGDIIITASRVAGAGVRSDGPQTVLTQADVAKVASVNRDIRDIERRDPFATIDLSNAGDRGGAVAFAGVNPRFNRFTINGVQVGDTFGLNQDASPTNRGPIPFDAIGQVSTSVAPYDFRQSGFQGGAVDVTLLKGTNEFHGTGFYSQNTDGLSGDRIGSTKIVNPKYKSETYGAMFRGPLIKDKLFFMVAAERNTDPRPFSTQVAQVPGLSQGIINNVLGITSSRFPAVQPGNSLVINPRKDEKIVGQIDWNITDRQKLSLSYINAYDSLVSQNNTSTSSSTPRYGLSSNAYALTELLRAGIVQLNSDWSDKISTEIRGIYKRTVRGQEPLQGRNTGQFQICTDAASAGSATGCSSGVPSVTLGPDNFRQTNELNFDTYEGSFLGRVHAGAHEVKLLVDVTRNHTFNNFVPNSLGSWYYDSLADYQNRRANQVQYAATIGGVANGAAADFNYTQFAFGLQDDWKVTDDLSITYGARMSLFAMRDAPVYNSFFNQRYGFTNTQTYKGLDLFEPRFSFNYRPSGFLPGLKLRGGAGIFGGGSPDIYLSNSFSNTLTTNSLTINRDASCNTAGSLCDLALNNVTGQVPAALVTAASSPTANPSLARTNTGALDSDFRLPRSLKATLSADYSFYGFNVGLDYYYSNTIDGIIFVDQRSVQLGTLPDGRPRYGNPYYGFGDNNYDIIVRNTSKGRSNIGVVRVNKDFDWGLSLAGSYTLQDVKDVGDATSSTINSNYRFQIFGDPNNPAYGISDNQTKWQFKYSVGYDHAFFGDYKTVFQLFGETRAGKPYSFGMLDNQSNRSAIFGTVLTPNQSTNLLYVPTSTTDPIVSYDSTATQNALDTLINNTALKNYRGRVAAKNIARNRAYTRIDLHLEQEIPTFIGGSRITLFGDINNLTNLLNSKWGGLRQLGFPASAGVVEVQCLTSAVPTGTSAAGVTANNTSQACAQYRYSSFKSPNESALNVTQSLYTIRIGARFTF